MKISALLTRLTVAFAVLFPVSVSANTDLTRDLEERDYPLSLSGSYLAALTANRARDHSAAALYFENALKTDPDNPILVERSFMLQLADGNIDAALELTDEILERDPENRFARLALGVTALKAKSFKKAERQFSNVGQGPLARLTGALLQAWTLAGDDDHQGALDTLANLEGPEWYDAFQFYHMGLIAELGGLTDVAHENLKIAYERDPNVLRTAEALARFQLRNGFETEGRELAESLVSRFPSRPSLQQLADHLREETRPSMHIATTVQGAMEVLYGLGSAIGREGGEEIAYVYLQLAVNLQPDNALPRLILGDLLENDKRYEKAIENYQAIPDDSIYRTNAIMRMAFAYNALEDLDEARRLMQALIKEQPDNMIALSSYGNILRSHELFEEAREVYTTAISKIALDPRGNHWSLYYSRGITNERTKRWPQAEVDFRKALELSPDQPQVLNYLGYSLIDLDMTEKFEEAIQMIRTAVGLRPNDAFIVDSLGWAYYKIGNYTEAVRHLERAVELRPQDPILNDHLGDAYWKVGRKLEAVFQWNHARDLDPEPEDLEDIVRKIENGLETDG